MGHGPRAMRGEEPAGSTEVGGVVLVIAGLAGIRAEDRLRIRGQVDCVVEVCVRFYMRMDMHGDKCVGMRVDMRTDMYVDMSMDMGAHAQTCLETCDLDRARWCGLQAAPRCLGSE